MMPGDTFRPPDLEIACMKLNTRIQQTARMALLALALGPLCCAAALATDQPEIKFAAGASKIALKGVINGMDRDIFPITGKAGQSLSVSVKNSKKLALFRIQLPGTEEKYLPKAGEEDDATSWSGKLPVDGKYLIVVGAMRGSDGRYTLNVELK
jgi:hypothetical protein